MAYGIKIWDSDGNVAINLSTRITRVIDTLVKSGGSSGTKYYAGWFKSEHGLFGLPILTKSPQVTSVPFEVWVTDGTNGATLHWRATDKEGHSSNNGDGDGIIYVMAYK